MISARLPCATISPPVTPAQAHIDDVVRRLDGLLIMFHNDHGVAGIPQLLEQHNELRVVFLVQSDTGLVENIKDPRQVRSELCSSRTL